MRWDDLTRSEFFRWFGVVETRRLTEGGELTIQCKPGGSKEAIDLAFLLDAAGAVRGARLVLDRAWMDNPATAPFAADITKSFLLTMGANDPAVQAVDQQIEHVMGTLPGVISRADRESGPPPLPSQEVSALLGTYLGQRDQAELVGASCLVTIDNSRAEDFTRRCHIRWSAR